MRFEGQVVAVTGGASGIGLGILRRFAGEGARVVALDLNAQAAQAAAEQLGAKDSALAVHLTEPFLVVNTRPVAILWEQLPAAVGLTCAVAVVAEIVPIVKLLSLDPNTILTEQ